MNLNGSMFTSATACEFAIDIHEVGEVLSLLSLRDVAALNGRVEHQLHYLLIKLLYLPLGLAHNTQYLCICLRVGE